MPTLPYKQMVSYSLKLETLFVSFPKARMFKVMVKLTDYIVPFAFFFYLQYDPIKEI